jgi:hypothetical protein
MEEIKKKVVLSGKFEDIIEVDEHYYLISKKNRVAVMPYSIGSQGLLDKVGVVKDYNVLSEDYDYTLISGYVSQDDGTNLVAANRILFEVLGVNITDADDWMYLGNLYNTLTSDSPISLYCVDLTNKEIKKVEEVEEEKKRAQFKMVDCEFVVTTDDSMFLAAFLRLFEFFYVNNLSNNSKSE